MGSKAEPLHILFFPLMAPGHMIPMVDMARLFAARGVKATIITTPANASLIQSTIDRANQSGLPPHPIRIVLIPFPSAAVGLPEGCENLSATSKESRGSFLKGVSMLRQPFDQVVGDLLPDCVITDMFVPWTVDVASERGVPRLVFHGTCCFSLCARETLDRHNTIESLPSDAESFVLPGLPHRIEMLRTQISDLHKSGPAIVELFNRMKESETRSYGVVVNSFYELEPDYAQHYRKVVGRKAWHIGPVSLCNTDEIDMSGRGNNNEASIDRWICLEWLGSKKPGSVLYACFGSLGTFTAIQLHEIALGLEASGHPFIWVVRNGGDWLPEGYEERIEGKGLLIRGWAPQILILNHPAVGGFLTHCGWNSSLEGVSAGVPMVTWPLDAEQFYNERLIVDVMEIGVAIGAEKCATLPEDRPVMGSAEIERAVDRLMMSGGEEADGRRSRARELMEMAKRAVEEGGSSFVDMGNLIKELMDRRAMIKS